MADDILYNSPGQVNWIITFKPATGSVVVPLQMLQVKRKPVSTWVDSKMHMRGLIKSKNVNTLLDLATSISGELQQLAFSSIVNVLVNSST